MDILETLVAAATNGGRFAVEGRQSARLLERIGLAICSRNTLHKPIPCHLTEAGWAVGIAATKRAHAGQDLRPLSIASRRRRALTANQARAQLRASLTFLALLGPALLMLALSAPH